MQSQYNHYMLWGERVIVHSIAQILLMIDPVWRKVLNSLAFSSYIYMIYKICNLNKSTNILLYTFVFFIAFVSLPILNQTVFWITDSANYLWGTLIVLPFVYYIYRYYITPSPETSNGWLKALCFGVYGIIAGWTNENLVVALIFFSLLYIIVLIRDKKNIPTWMITGFIGLCIGAAFLILAPGNFIRTEAIDNAIHFSSRSPYHLLRMRVKSIVNIYVLNYSLILFSIIYLALFLYVLKYRIKNVDKKFLFGSFSFFLCSHVSMLAMLAAPIFPPRASFCSVSFLIISLGMLHVNMPATKGLRNVSLAFFTTIFLLYIYVYRTEYGYIKNFSDIIEQRELIISQQKEIGNRNIIFTEGIKNIDKLEIEDLSSDSTFWLNQECCLYYDLESVRLIPKSVDHN